MKTAKAKSALMNSDSTEIFSRHWLRWLLLLWILSAAGLVMYRWPQINWFALGDTDDNLRMMQVRALLKGQDWFDLRQYRLNPPLGANIHWSHLVDLPMAAIILIFKPFLGGEIAEKIAIALAPIIPLGVVFVGLGLTVRRLVAPASFIVAAAIFLCSYTALLMFMPTRIDHHGWQLAMLTLMLAGLADPKQMRGGLTVGIATALSLVIGLEMLLYLAIGGAAVGLRWIMDQDQRVRLRSYGASLAIGVAVGFAGFASYANRVPRCDALTPVWLSVMVLAGALLVALSFIRAEKTSHRFLLAGIAGALSLAFLVLVWPDCLGRPEQVSPELERLWLANISEAKPLYKQNWPTILSVSVLLIGLFGSFWALWRERMSERGAAWASVALLSLLSALMLLWQTRAAASALMFAVPGATALGWAIIPWLRAHNNMLVRVFGTTAAFMLVSGLWAQLVIGQIPNPNVATPRMKLVNKANSTCPTMPALRPIALLPKATIMTFVDLGPRLVTVTHHNAIAGPYHRNGDAILDIHKVFRGPADGARAIMQRHGATMLLICPNMSESTIYAVQNPKGFYVQLAKGQVPDWLEPVALPPRSPYKLWRVKG
jgi:hypothetical protein